MAKKAIAVALIAAMLTLSACSAIKVNENDSTEVAVKEYISFTVGKEEESENVVTSEPTGELTVQTSKSETTTADLKTSDNVTTTKPTTTTKKNSETKITTTKTTQKVETTKTKPTTAQTKAPTTAIKPTAVKTTAATTQTPTTAKPFDINYWINFTKSYAQSIGLSLDSGATGCWDNPMTASARCIYLERDITGTLNSYKNNEGVTAIWVWSEYIGNGEYLLYIGYA